MKANHCLMKELDVNSAIAGEIMTSYVIMLKTDAGLEDVEDNLSKNKISAVFIYDNSKDEYYFISADLEIKK